MDLGLQGKRAIVTGGTLGIGKAIARELAAETGRRITPLVADVTSKAQVDAMVAQAAVQLGGLHILVNSGSPPGARPQQPAPSTRWR